MHVINGMQILQSKSNAKGDPFPFVVRDGVIVQRLCQRTQHGLLKENNKAFDGIATHKLEQVWMPHVFQDDKGSLELTGHRPCAARRRQHRQCRARQFGSATTTTTTIAAAATRRTCHIFTDNDPTNCPEGAFKGDDVINNVRMSA